MLITFAVMAAVCAVLALFATLVNWWFEHTATGSRRADGQRPVRDETPLPDLPRQPGAEDTQQIAIADVPAPRTVHVPEPFADDTTVNLPLPKPQWPPMREQQPEPIAWRPGSTDPARIPAWAVTQPLPRAVPDGADTERMPAVQEVTT